MFKGSASYSECKGKNILLGQTERFSLKIYVTSDKEIFGNLNTFVYDKIVIPTTT